MSRALIIAALLSPLFILSAIAQLSTIQKAVWVKPAGDAPNYLLAIRANTSVELAWNGYDAKVFVSIGFFDTKKLANLWVVDNEDVSQTPFSQLLSTNINLTQSGTYRWNAILPSQQLDRSTKYKLQFKPSSKTYIVADAEISSPGFVVLEPLAAPMESSISSPTAATWSALPTSVPPGTSATSSTSPTTLLTTSSQSVVTGSTTPLRETQLDLPQAEQTTQRTNINTITIGAAVGGSVGGALIIGVLTFLLLRRTRARKSTHSDMNARTYSDIMPVTPTSSSSSKGYVRGSPTGGSTESGTYYSPDDIVIYPPPDIYGAKDEIARTPVAELATGWEGMAVSWEKKKRSEEFREVAELPAGDGHSIRR